MAGYKKHNHDGPTAEDKALVLFASMMIEKIESLTAKDNWQKPWFTDGAMQWPKNLSGREYNGMNALLLMMHCEKEGYKVPRFATFDSIQRLNAVAEEKARKRGEGNAPRVCVNKGEHSFPVCLTTFTCIDKDTKDHIKYDDYKQLSDEEKKRYNVYPKMSVFRVFNVGGQTNIQAARPDLWEKFVEENALPKREEGNLLAFEPIDVMIRDSRWICPIKTERQDNAYYSLSKEEIVVPEKSQFKDGESFYGTLLHEMTHSTGSENALGRIKPSAFGSDDYAREELVAELGSALVCQRYGMAKNLKQDSATYLKSWLDSLRESPQFIKTTLVDVKKATSMICQNIDRISLELEQKADKTQMVEEERDNDKALGIEVQVKTAKPKEQEQPEAVVAEEQHVHRGMRR